MEVMRALMRPELESTQASGPLKSPSSFSASRLGDRVVRISVEPLEVPAETAIKLVEETHRALDESGLTARSRNLQRLSASGTARSRRGRFGFQVRSPRAHTGDPHLREDRRAGGYERRVGS
jgi:hypothetical protein